MNENLLQVVNDEIFTSSRRVAEKFNKNHKDILRKIEDIVIAIEESAILRPPHLFEISTYMTPQNKLQPEYLMNRDGFTLLAMGFTGKEALTWKLKYIEAFNEMERRLHSQALIDNRFELAKLIATTPKSNLPALLDLYPEYFSHKSAPGSLEYISDLNTSYTKWIADYQITIDWISDFPTTDIYLSYKSYCTENHLLSMGKKIFYKTLEDDFGLSRGQRSDGFRYFKTA
jgi:Rha family phage regulatory protein